MEAKQFTQGLKMLNSHRSPRDFEGYIDDPASWNRQLARELAADEQQEPVLNSGRCRIS